MLESMSAGHRLMIPQNTTAVKSLPPLNLVFERMIGVNNLFKGQNVNYQMLSTEMK